MSSLEIKNLHVSIGDKERLYGFLEGGGRMILAEPEAAKAGVRPLMHAMGESRQFLRK